MLAWIFPVLMLSALLFVLLFGDSEERLAIGVLVLNFVGTALLYWHGGSDWLRPQFSIFLLDAFCLAIFLVIAFRSKRFWPLPIAAFQTVPVLTFFVTAVGVDLSSKGIGVTQGAWGYAQLVIMLLATIRRRNQKNASNAS